MAAKLARFLGLFIVGVVALTSSTTRAAAQARDATTSRINVGTLANDSNPADLDFQGAECLVAASGQSMDCAFQQVFLSVAPFDSRTCLVTTNSFERHFEKESETRWVSREVAQGTCGDVDTATLTNDGGEVRWSLEYRKTRTQRADAACRGDDPATERYSWKNARRPLPCQFIQPGAVR